MSAYEPFYMEEEEEVVFVDDNPIVREDRATSARASRPTATVWNDQAHLTLLQAVMIEAPPTKPQWDRILRRVNERGYWYTQTAVRRDQTVLMALVALIDNVIDGVNLRTVGQRGEGRRPGREQVPEGTSWKRTGLRWDLVIQFAAGKHFPALHRRRIPCELLTNCDREMRSSASENSEFGISASLAYMSLLLLHVSEVVVVGSWTYYPLVEDWIDGTCIAYSSVHRPTGCHGSKD